MVGSAAPSLIFAENLVVEIPNTSPSISSIPTQSIYMNSSLQNLQFSISDKETPPAALVVAAISSNTSLIPSTVNNIAVTNMEGNNSRHLKIVPSAGVAGSSTITLTVSDGSLSSTTSFRINVQVPMPSSITVPANDVDGLFAVKWSAVTGATSYVLEYRKSGQSWSQLYSGLENAYPVSLQAGTYDFQVKACASLVCSAYKTSHSIIISGSQSNMSRRVIFVHTDSLGSPAAETNEQGNENE